MKLPDFLGRDFDTVMAELSAYGDIKVVVKETKSPKNKLNCTTRAKRVIKQTSGVDEVTLIVADI